MDIKMKNCNVCWIRAVSEKKTKVMYFNIKVT